MTTDIATIPARKPVDVALAQLDTKFVAGSLAKSLPEHISYDRFRACVQLAISQDSSLLSEDARPSLILACMQAASDGLLLDKRQAALVCYRGREGTTVQYMPMVAGVLRLIRNSGLVSTIGAWTVYDGDEFSYSLGLDPTLQHRPTLGDRGRAICHYAVAKLKDGSVQFLVYTEADIAKRRTVSRSKTGPWQSWYEEMAQKTVLRGLCKMLPSSRDIDIVIDRMDVDTDLSIAPAPARSSLAISSSMVDEVEIPALTGEIE